MKLSPRGVLNPVRPEWISVIFPPDSSDKIPKAGILLPISYISITTSGSSFEFMLYSPTDSFTNPEDMKYSAWPFTYS